MSERETYKLGIDIVTPVTGAAGDLLNDNARVIADKLEQIDTAIESIQSGGGSGYSGYSGISGRSGSSGSSGRSGFSGLSGYSGRTICSTSYYYTTTDTTPGELVTILHPVGVHLLTTTDFETWTDGIYTLHLVGGFWQLDYDDGDGSVGEWVSDASGPCPPINVSAFEGFEGGTRYQITAISNTGLSGTSGRSGRSGNSGSSGRSGVSGISGYSGGVGTSGNSGYSGVGTSGVSGVSGQAGGLSGTSGVSGTSGISGTSGSSGRSGTSGYSGRSGFSGVSGFSVLNAKTYGAIGDGTSHPLSEFYGDLPSAQAVYPFASALTDEIDWCAIQKAMSYNQNNTDRFLNGFEPGGVDRGENVYIPAGHYILNKPLTLWAGSEFRGDGFPVTLLAFTLTDSEEWAFNLGSETIYQTVDLSAGNDPAGGTWALTYNGETASGIAYDASAATVKTALEGLSTVGSGNIMSVVKIGFTYRIHFSILKSWDSQNPFQPLALTANGASLTGGGISVTVTSGTYATSCSIRDLYVTCNGGGIKRRATICVGVRLSNMQFDCGNTGYVIDFTFGAEHWPLTEDPDYSQSNQFENVYFRNCAGGLWKLQGNLNHWLNCGFTGSTIASPGDYVNIIAGDRNSFDACDIESIDTSMYSLYISGQGFALRNSWLSESSGPILFNNAYGAYVDFIIHHSATSQIEVTNTESKQSSVRIGHIRSHVAESFDDAFSADSNSELIVETLDTVFGFPSIPSLSSSVKILRHIQSGAINDSDSMVTLSTSLPSLPYSVNLIPNGNLTSGTTGITNIYAFQCNVALTNQARSDGLAGRELKARATLNTTGIGEFSLKVDMPNFPSTARGRAGRLRFNMRITNGTASHSNVFLMVRTFGDSPILSQSHSAAYVDSVTGDRVLDIPATAFSGSSNTFFTFYFSIASGTSGQYVDVFLTDLEYVVESNFRVAPLPHMIYVADSAARAAAYGAYRGQQLVQIDTNVVYWCTDPNTAGSWTAMSVTIASSPPASASATGSTGTITWDSSYIYVCTATNTWKRVAISTW